MQWLHRPSISTKQALAKTKRAQELIIAIQGVPNGIPHPGRSATNSRAKASPTIDPRIGTTHQTSSQVSPNRHFGAANQDTEYTGIGENTLGAGSRTQPVHHTIPADHQRKGINGSNSIHQDGDILARHPVATNTKIAKNKHSKLQQRSGRHIRSSQPRASSAASCFRLQLVAEEKPATMTSNTGTQHQISVDSKESPQQSSSFLHQQQVGFHV
ncbi:hypothetical protein Nepgr_031431 [Nepenthes gracilis]|uniref:Uncharacterized protein n=1 Tax=Nepenthes gracilis TaxID=150966 RepID=A0AAD3TIF2_NEPGR|nr:hypothetical protein Nepgr_031431 [Nepenthes gracilis]